MTQAGTSYTVQILLGTCYESTLGGDCAKLLAYPSAPPAVTPAQYFKLIRSVAIVRWTTGQGCLAGCSYMTSSLVDPNADLDWVTHG